MRGLASTLSTLLKHRRDWGDAWKTLGERPAPQPGSPESALTHVTGFGRNPGALEMFTHVPDRLPPAPALVVVLHGCGQDAAGYDAGAGWSALADEQGFVLLFPQQTKANNPKACFNWFLPGDVARDGAGEARSIREMIDRAVADHAVDRSRIFITGLSAGGAMANAMLAAYPEVFAGGAVLAGLPYGAAINVQTALDSMFQGKTKSSREWGDLVRSASGHTGRWPRISIWYGEADKIVKPMNGVELVKQWTDLHGLGLEPTKTEDLGVARREIWRDETGETAVEAFAVPGMGHGTALHVGPGEMEGGAAGPFMLDVGISSTHHIARAWGLIGESATQRTSASRSVGSARRPALQGEVLPPEKPSVEAASGTKKLGPISLPDSVPAEVLAVIQKAFKSAGLVR